MTGDVVINLKKIMIMKTLKSISGREFKISGNKSKRTFTIVTNGIKYRTLPMSRAEYENADNWTGNDWSQFMRTNDYYKVE
jgi:hypothetical protein